MQFIPKPKSLLFLVSLKTAVELICIFTVFNKASGIYGMLALLTGAPISLWQMSMYLYSIIAAGIFAYSLRHIKEGPGSAVEVLAFAWFYVFDTLVNFGYTALFASSWFLVLSQQNGGSATDTMNGTAGFTNPTHTVSAVTVMATQAASGEHITEMHGVPATQLPALGESVLHPEQLPSILALLAILLVKVYFILIVMSYARWTAARATGSSMSPYNGRKQQIFGFLTKGSYWKVDEDHLRLTKVRSMRRDDEGRR